MNVFVFPGQGAQYEGMANSLEVEKNSFLPYFEKASNIVGKDLLEIMTNGDAQALKQTDVTQPSLFVHSVLSYFKHKGEHTIDAVAGHSLGEFSALVAAGVLDFEQGIALVHQRATAMQKACEEADGTMAAIIGMEDQMVEELCAATGGAVVPANYNCPGQLVVSGTESGIEAIIAKAKEAGARMAIKLEVGGAFHSPLMKSAENELANAINATEFNKATYAVYQNVDGLPYKEVDELKSNLIKQLTSPVRWTQTMQNLEKDGLSHQYELGGNGKVLTGLLKRYNRKIASSSLN